MEQSLAISLISLGVGALLGGLGQAAVSRYAAFKEGRGVAQALRAEISAIIEIVQHRQYIQQLKQIVQELSNPAVQLNHQHFFNATVGQDYLIVFRSLGYRIGLLDSTSGIIGQFYTLVRAAIEDLHSLSVMHNRARQGHLPFNRVELLNFTQNLLHLCELALTTGQQAVSELSIYQDKKWLRCIP